MESFIDYTHQLAFKTIDSSNIGFIEIKTLDGFFKRNRMKGITLEDNAAVIRRLDLDGDGRLRFDEFVKGIEPQ